MKATSNLIVNDSGSALTLGDTQYELGHFQLFNSPTYLGRVKPITIQQLETTNTLLPVHQAITATLGLLAASQSY